MGIFTGRSRRRQKNCNTEKEIVSAHARLAAVRADDTKRHNHCACPSDKPPPVFFIATIVRAHATPHHKSALSRTGNAGSSFLEETRFSRRRPAWLAPSSRRGGVGGLASCRWSSRRNQKRCTASAPLRREMRRRAVRRKPGFPHRARLGSDQLVPSELPSEAGVASQVVCGSTMFGRRRRTDAAPHADRDARAAQTTRSGGERGEENAMWRGRR